MAPPESHSAASTFAADVADVVGGDGFRELLTEHVLGFPIGYRGKRLAASCPVRVAGEPPESRGVLRERPSQDALICKALSGHVYLYEGK